MLSEFGLMSTTKRKADGYGAGVLNRETCIVKSEQASRPSVFHAGIFKTSADFSLPGWKMKGRFLLSSRV